MVGLVVDRWDRVTRSRECSQLYVVMLWIATVRLCARSEFIGFLLLAQVRERTQREFWLLWWLVCFCFHRDIARRLPCTHPITLYKILRDSILRALTVGILRVWPRISLQFWSRKNNPSTLPILVHYGDEGVGRKNHKVVIWYDKNVCQISLTNISIFRLCSVNCEFEIVLSLINCLFRIHRHSTHWNCFRAAWNSWASFKNF